MTGRTSAVQIQTRSVLVTVAAPFEQLNLDTIELEDQVKGDIIVIIFRILKVLIKGIL